MDALFNTYILNLQAREVIPSLEVEDENKFLLESARVPTTEEEIDLDLLDLLPDDNENNISGDPDYETSVPNNKIKIKTNKQEEEEVEVGEEVKDENIDLQCYYCCQIFLRSDMEEHMRYVLLKDFFHFFPS